VDISCGAPRSRFPLETTTNRRAFLIGVGGAMTMAALSRRPDRVLAQELVEFNLTSAPMTFEPSPGTRFAGLAYNGSIPGPLLRVTYGQRVRVRYRSSVETPTSVHWHGMILPNDMDGVANVSQPPAPSGGEFVYEFAPNPPGTRWYHDHAFQMGAARGLFGMFIVDDPAEEPGDKEFALVFHDVPQWSTVEAAERGISTVAMTAVPGSPETMEMMASMRAMQRMQPRPAMRMGDEVKYVARCINGATYPRTPRFAVRVGDRVRLRLLNASPTRTHYVRLAEHRLTVTHSDGNRLARTVEVDALRLGVAERYDADFEVSRSGAFLLQTLMGPGLEQAAVFYTEGMEHAPPVCSPQTLAGVDYFTYEKAGGATNAASVGPATRYDLTLGGGAWDSSRWTIDGKIWPNTPKIRVRRGELVAVHFKNTTDMEHPMHLHGHAFSLVETGGTWFARPLVKDVSLVPANGGTATWQFSADSPAGRWLLHCHNDVHMTDGMMTEIVYES
jgi:multicopper oxidase